MSWILYNFNWLRVRTYSLKYPVNAYKASNPKYCYKWSFIEPGKVVVLSLWFDTMEEFGGTIIKEGNYRIDAQKYKGNEQKQKVNRTIEMDQCIRKAFYEKLPVRVIVCDGIKAGSAPDIKNSSASFICQLTLFKKIRLETKYLD